MPRTPQSIDQRHYLFKESRLEEEHNDGVHDGIGTKEKDKSYKKKVMTKDETTSNTMIAEVVVELMVLGGYGLKDTGEKEQ